ncbi:MAG TPA: methyltransferase [Enhygromyxa sp.]|nr:methyltransferase [Enhygromyxa sp.]
MPMSRLHKHVTLSLALGLSLVACDKNKTETVSSDDVVAAEKEPTSAQPEFPDLASVLASPHRAENAARDAARHPKETLEFFGVERDMTVVELWPGGGWYTEILGPYLRDEGKLIVTNMSTDHERYGKSAKKFQDKLEGAPELYGDVTIVPAPTAADQPFELAPEGTVDVILTFRNSHGWFNNGLTELIYGAAFRALEPGGIFGVVQHRAAEGAKPEETAKQGYLPEAQVIAAAQAVGFELVEKSEINANPKDTKNHPAGVWSLPPNLSGAEGKEQTEEEKAKYSEIGESDRMTLKFRKPG